MSWILESVGKVVASFILNKAKDQMVKSVTEFAKNRNWIEGRKRPIEKSEEKMEGTKVVSWAAGATPPKYIKKATIIVQDPRIIALCTEVSLDKVFKIRRGSIRVLDERLEEMIDEVIKGLEAVPKKFGRFFEMVDKLKKMAEEIVKDSFPRIEQEIQLILDKSSILDRIETRDDGVESILAYFINMLKRISAIQRFELYKNDLDSDDRKKQFTAMFALMQDCAEELKTYQPSLDKTTYKKKAEEMEKRIVLTAMWPASRVITKRLLEFSMKSTFGDHAVDDLSPPKKTPRLYPKPEADSIIDHFYERIICSDQELPETFFVDIRKLKEIRINYQSLILQISVYLSCLSAVGSTISKTRGFKMQLKSEIVAGMEGLKDEKALETADLKCREFVRKIVEDNNIPCNPNVYQEIKKNILELSKPDNQFRKDVKGKLEDFVAKQDYRDSRLKSWTS
uniref:Cilia- and flagella-associated protein 206 n=1 Tax=Caenorhabditis tropicalis TaxID=1561998 RepID=A0A1I7V112_9PELO